jgi:hypothetical protein
MAHSSPDTRTDDDGIQEASTAAAMPRDSSFNFGYFCFMSSLPGGPADKAGLIHEALWGVYGMLEVLRGGANAIRIEEPRVDGAEFYLQRGAIREQWQAKRQVLSQKTWSLRLLKTEGVLDFFLNQLRAGEVCVFASITDAPELAGLANDANDAKDWEEFRDKFLNIERRGHFKELCQQWGNLPETEAFNLLKRVHVEGGRERTLESLLACILQVSFTGPPQTALAVLHRLYECSVHQTLNAGSILAHLDSRGIKSRTVTEVAGLRDVVQGITKSYLAGQRSKLIRRELIPRKAATDLVARLAGSDTSLDILVISPAGGGKSGCLVQIVEELSTTGMPVLAFRLDRIEPVSSTEALGGKLDLPESPAVVLARCYAGHPVTLVLDQLDYVSATSGRHAEFFDTVASLVDEIHGLRASGRFHLVLACRQFDFEYDHRLRRLLPPGGNPVKVDLLTDAEVKQVVSAEGGDPSRLSTSQLKLLQLPQNLSLFIEAGLAAEASPGFVTQKELFDAYWGTKRRAVTSRCPAEPEQWIEVIKTVTNEMSTHQELSVPKAQLDAFATGFLNAMVSEGVLTFDGRRYGFGHESFFDYCFARTVAGGNFIQFLEGDDQQLFRRAQLRQMLVYLRDDDVSRYLVHVREVLGSERIRPHLKLLVLDLLASFSNPRNDELVLLMPYLESEFFCRRTGTRNVDKMSSRALDAFFSSHSLFIAADRLGYVEHWLHSGEVWLEDLTAAYLRFQAQQHSDRVAELLEPFVGRGEPWAKRLRWIMQWGDCGKSRRYFDLFLGLLDDGTLDELSDRPVNEHTFWSALYQLGDNQPRWCAEVAAHWLDRQIARALASAGQSLPVALNDYSASDQLEKSACNAPAEFIQHVLPVILRAAKAFQRPVPDGLPRDRIWLSRHKSDHHAMPESYLMACELAFHTVSKTDPAALGPLIRDLLRCRLYTANHLLQEAYLSAPEFYAEEAMALLASEPDRLFCGFSDNATWLSRCLIEKCSPFCSDATFRKLEAAVLAFTTSNERSRGGFRCRGQRAFMLASALAQNRRSASTNARIDEWSRKFTVPDHPPHDIRAYTVVSPIPKESAEHMTDDQWLRAITKYNTARFGFDWDHPEKGGAESLAGLLHDFVGKEPERFAKLALRFPVGVNPSYYMNTLYGLKNAPVNSALKLDVARLVFASDDEACLMAVLDLLGTIGNLPLPDDAVQFIQRMAIEYRWQRADHGGEEPEDIRIDGRNSVPGHAVETIANLINCDACYLDKFGETAEKLMEHPDLSVRACVASMLVSIAVHDPSRAIRLFHRLLATDDRLLATNYVVNFIQQGLRSHVEELRPHIERMLSSLDPQVHQEAGRLACLACLCHESAADLAEKALAGDAASRLGAAKIASYNFIYSECREWCEVALRRLFDDMDVNVRKEAAHCFWHLWRQPELPLEEFDSLIRAFIKSAAFEDDPTFVLHALEDTRQRVPETILDVCECFATKCAEKARDIRTSIGADEHMVSRLVFRAYAQLGAWPLQKRALDLIDQMCASGLPSVGDNIALFER